MVGKITYFRNYWETLNPYYVDPAKAVERIKTGSVKEQIEWMRGMEDSAKRKAYKNSKLPCVLWSGVFTQRKDACMTDHSGLCSVDFDHIDVEDYKKKLSPYRWIYAMFTSPSGDGLKVIVRIPKSIEDHRAHYMAIQEELKWLPGFDTTSKNESRICFESYDPDVYFNPEAIEFDKKIEIPSVISKYDGPVREAVVTNYSLLDRAVRKVLNAPDGQKHSELLGAARLCGGWVVTGVVDEQEAIQALEKAIASRDISDFEGAQKTIRDGIEYGKQAPVEGEVLVAVEESEDGVKVYSSGMEHVSDYENEKEYMHAVRTQTLPMGLSTGFDKMDMHFRFKPGNFVIINGHDNVGKSTFIWYLAVLSNILHKWKWIFYCAENTEGQIRKSLIQFKTGKAIHHLTDSEYEVALQWAYDNFTIIKAENMLSWRELLKISSVINAKKHHDAFLVDPYNALDVDLKNTTMSSHEYHYMVTSQMRMFCKQWKTAIYLNCHAITEALRRTHKDGPYAGFPEPPGKADTEGGGKFSNRADEFITLHRYVQHPNEFYITHAHIRKVKETETGGRPTAKDDPVLFKMEKGHFGFFDVDTCMNPVTGERVVGELGKNIDIGKKR